MATRSDWVEAYVNPELAWRMQLRRLPELWILLEQISEQAEWRRMIREYLWEHARITSELKTDDAAGAVYRQYHTYRTGEEDPSPPDISD